MLHKAIYGLKQAPKAWFVKFTTQLLNLGFEASSDGGNFFILKHDSYVIYIILYVDGIVITGNHSSIIAHLIKKISSSFDLKGLGFSSYFLCYRLILLLMAYLSTKLRMLLIFLPNFICLTANLVRPPCFPSHYLTHNDSPLVLVPSPYRILVAASQYLTFTRPDMSYVVQQACDHMSQPTQNNILLLNKIFII